MCTFFNYLLFKMINDILAYFLVFLSNIELSKYKKISRTIKQHSYVYYYIICMYIYKEILIFVVLKSSSALDTLTLNPIMYFSVRHLFRLEIESVLQIISPYFNFDLFPYVSNK